ncbi:hypothetical protein QFZ76_005079 [Streptomyces sp. V4I2]|nr:hypothetical protein [Streptomyces sp. V4I2]
MPWANEATAAIPARRLPIADTVAVVSDPSRSSRPNTRTVWVTTGRARGVSGLFGSNVTYLGGIVSVGSMVEPSSVGLQLTRGGPDGVMLIQPVGRGPGQLIDGSDTGEPTLWSTVRVTPSSAALLKNNVKPRTNQSAGRVPELCFLVMQPPRQKAIDREGSRELVLKTFSPSSARRSRRRWPAPERYTPSSGTRRSPSCAILEPGAGAAARLTLPGSTRCTPHEVPFNSGDMAGQP